MICFTLGEAEVGFTLGEICSTTSKVRAIFSETGVTLKESCLTLGEVHSAFEDLDDEKTVDYEADTDTYLTEPDDTGIKGYVSSSSYMPDDEPRLETIGEAAPISIPTGGEFESTAYLDGALESELTIDIVASSAPTLFCSALQIGYS
ncbi:uncharacterized protein A4U43_C01F25220 [Asparagus officinalis]|uniref:Uncharacterized protein n=1 Tax=Asparagus officinalis TaxID=4686 RepID=A0A5P1FSV2_ASPOF|nr:uncharacterized protein A4U43_C01F25220 [Asparagus officinalis]